MRYVFTAILFLSFTFGFGQENTTPKEDAKLIKENDKETTFRKFGEQKAEVPSEDKSIDYSKIFNSVQVQAIPPGGLNAFRKYIATNFKLPEVTEKTKGTVFAKFVVWDDGSIRDVQIIREEPSGLGLGKEAIRVISSSEKWIPGMFNGFKVKQYYTLPISIQITPAEKKEKPLEEAKKDKQ